MTVLLVRTPDESYAAPFLQNSRDEVVIDTTDNFSGHADRVVITGIVAEPAALRAALDSAFAHASDSVDIGPLVGSPTIDGGWVTALIGLRLIEVTADGGVPVARVQADDNASEIESALLVGALIALPQNSIEPPVPASAPAPSSSMPKKPAAPKAKSTPPQSIPKRVISLVRSRRKQVGVLAAAALVAVALAIAAFAIAGGYYTAVAVTALLGMVTLSALRTEQQHRRLLAGELAFQSKQAKRAMFHFRRMARSMGVVELTTIENKKILSRTEGTARIIRTDIAHHFEQVQATLNLFELVQVDGMLPPMRGWAASPDVVGVLLEELRATNPKLIVECGSGVSTLFLALAAKQHSPETRIVALDHDPEYANKTRALLERHGVAEFADVRDAPLTEGVEGHTWYDPTAIENLKDIDLLFVDGPPKTTGPLARMPAVPVLWDRLAPKGIIVLDDMIRDDEQTIAASWQAAHPELVRHDVSTEKGTTILRR